MKPDAAGSVDHGNSAVKITVNDETFTLHRGRQSVEALKKVAGVPLAHDLNLFAEGKLETLADDASVTIKGGEVFVSHPKDGSSS